MAPPKKTAKQYEKEAVVIGKCLIHESQGAARKVYILRHGSISSKILVCHKCDNPKCIKDSHHFAGSNKDNTQDAVRKGRHSGFRTGGVRFSGLHSEEAKLKISEAVSNQWQIPSVREKRTKGMSATFSKFTQAQWAARGVKIWEKRREKK